MLLLPLVLLLGLSWPRPGPHPTTHIAHSPQKPLSLSPPPYWSQCHQLAHLRPRRPVTSCPATAPVSPRSLCCCLLLLLPASCFLLPAACCLLPAALLQLGLPLLAIPACFLLLLYVACLFCLLALLLQFPPKCGQTTRDTHTRRPCAKKQKRRRHRRYRAAQREQARIGGCNKPLHFTKSRAVGLERDLGKALEGLERDLGKALEGLEQRRNNNEHKATGVRLAERGGGDGLRGPESTESTLLYSLVSILKQSSNRSWISCTYVVNKVCD